MGTSVQTHARSVTHTHGHTRTHTKAHRDCLMFEKREGKGKHLSDITVYLTKGSRGNHRYQYIFTGIAQGHTVPQAYYWALPFFALGINLLN